MKSSIVPLFFLSTLLTLWPTFGTNAQFSHSNVLYEKQNECFELSQQQQVEAALQCYQEVLQDFRQVNDQSGIGYSLIGVGAAYISLGNFPAAIIPLEEAAGIGRSQDELELTIFALNNLGSAYAQMGEPERAFQDLEQAREIARRSGNSERLAMVLNTLGFAYQNANRYSEAIEVLTESLQIARQHNDVDAEMTALWDLGSAYSAQGDKARAIEVLEGSLAIARRLDDTSAEGFILTRLGSVYSDLGNYPKALEVQERNLALAREGNNPNTLATALLNIAATHMSLGQIERAQTAYEESIPIFQQSGNRGGEASALVGLGLINANLGDSARAQQFYTQSLAIAEDINDLSLASLILSNWSLIQSPGDAFESLQLAYEYAVEIGDPSKQGWALSQLAYFYYQQNDYEQAVDHYEQAANLFRQLGELRAEAFAYGGMGFTYLQMDRLSEAEQILYRSIDIQDRLRGGLSDENKVSIFDTQGNSYETLQDVLVRQGKYSAALEVAERSRARAFVDLLAQRLSSEAIEAEILPPPSISEIQAIARSQKATLVEYSLIYDAKVLLIWVVTPTGINFERVYLGNESIDSIEDIISSSRQALGARDRGGFEIVFESNLELEATNLKKLHEILIKPVKDYLPTNPGDRVIFIPQGQLFLVPFAALQDGDENYLIEKHTILTAPSIQVLDLTSQKRSIQTYSEAIDGSNLLVIGNPVYPEVSPTVGQPPQSLASLPGAEVEATEIGNLFGLSPLLRAEATELAIKQQIESARIVHFATHGLLEYGSPQDSGIRDLPGAIALTPGQGEDGLLTAAEIRTLSLQAELVVLSACDTGLGNITGDGVIGLSRSFIEAGTPSIIVSLWSVPDAPTAALMTEFYRQLQQGQDKAQALRKAMLITLKNHPEPRDWAAFTLIGEAE